MKVLESNDGDGEHNGRDDHDTRDGETAVKRDGEAERQCQKLSSFFHGTVGLTMRWL